MTTQNQALLDELEAVNSIYDESTCTITATDAISGATSTVLALPDLPFSFLISFSSEYPDVPPEILSTQSTGASTKIGQGEAAASLLRDILGGIFVPGQVCLFDLIEETVPILKQHFSDSSNDEIDDHRDHNGTIEDQSKTPTIRSAAPSTKHISAQLQTLHIQDLTPSKNIGPATTTARAPPNWILSEPLVVNRSTFVGRVVAVNSLDEATDSISHLLATNKRVASAAHNITAWRIKQKHDDSESLEPGKYQTQNQHQVSEIVIQDCDDDGETAAGGRLLHLMQLMDVWNVVVVVTRWYGGVKLGPDRFRCINSVAREALVKGGYSKDEHEAKGTSGKAKGKKK